MNNAILEFFASQKAENNVFPMFDFRQIAKHAGVSFSTVYRFYKRLVEIENDENSSRSRYLHLTNKNGVAIVLKATTFGDQFSSKKKVIGFTTYATYHKHIKLLYAPRRGGYR